jgi:hypothetical protein
MVSRTVVWCCCAAAAGATAISILIAGWGYSSTPTPAADGGSAQPHLTFAQFAESVRNDDRFTPGPGQHDYDAVYAVQKAMTRDSVDAMPDYDATVRFIMPSDSDCIGGHGPSHGFFVYKKDGAISTGVVCEDAKEDWYVTGLQLVKEGTGKRVPGE